MLRKIGRVWYYQTKTNGTTWTRSTGETDKRRAQARVPPLDQEARLLRQRPAGLPETLSEAIVHEVDQLEVRVSPRQAQRVGDSLICFKAWLGKDPPLTRITTQTLDAYAIHRAAQGRAASTIDKDLTYIRRMLRRCGCTIDKPARVPAAHSTYRALNDAELQRLFAQAPAAWSFCWLFLLYTGARAAEVLPSRRSTHEALQRHEIDLDTGLITLRQAKQRAGKDPKVRTIQFPESLLPDLRAHIDATPHLDPHLFAGSDRPCQPFLRAVDRAGIPRTTPSGKIGLHSLRKTYITALSRILRNAWQLKDALGHSDIRTTAIYVQDVAPVIPVADLRLKHRNVRGVSSGCKEAQEGVDPTAQAE